MATRMSLILAILGFTLWGLSVFSVFTHHLDATHSFILTIIGIVCVLVSFGLKNLETRLDALEGAVRSSRSTGVRSTDSY